VFWAVFEKLFFKLLIQRQKATAKEAQHTAKTNAVTSEQRTFARDPERRSAAKGKYKSKCFERKERKNLRAMKTMEGKDSRCRGRDRIWSMEMGKLKQRMGRVLALAMVAAVVSVAAGAQQEVHGRKFKPLPPTAHVVVVVEKGFNGKPLENAAVIFHSMLNGKEDANLEMKTDPDGKATIDLLEVGAHVTVQVIANGFSTFATDFDVTADGREVLVKLERPKAQVSTYVDNTGKPAQVAPGVQEHVVTKPGVTGSTGTTGTTAPGTTPK
jgi:hypothetical protein